MAEVASLAVAAGGSFMQSAATLGSSLGAAAMQRETTMESQQKSQNFQREMVSRGENAFEQSGLPKFMYYSGTDNGPNTFTHLGGNNYAETTGVNSNLPYYSSSPFQQIYHGGKPNLSALNNTRTVNFQRAGLGYGSNNISSSPSGFYDNNTSSRSIPRATNNNASNYYNYARSMYNYGNQNGGFSHMGTQTYTPGPNMNTSSTQTGVKLKTLTPTVRPTTWRAIN